MHWELDVGFDPESPGSRPEPKAGAKPLCHPGIPHGLAFLMRGLSQGNGPGDYVLEFQEDLQPRPSNENTWVDKDGLENTCHVPLSQNIQQQHLHVLHTQPIFSEPPQKGISIILLQLVLDSSNDIISRSWRAPNVASVEQSSSTINSQRENKDFGRLSNLWKVI